MSVPKTKRQRTLVAEAATAAAPFERHESSQIPDITNRPSLVMNDSAYPRPDMRPADPIVRSLLTDLYQVTMAYAYWKSGKRDDEAVFDLFFRKNPFHGEYTVFCGLEECIRFIANFKYYATDIAYLKTQMPDAEPEFFDYLAGLDGKSIDLYAIDEGSVVFPRVPLLRVEGPLPIVQLLETTLLTLINFASLVATNAARFRFAAGDNVKLLEFGLRRAQGPDGGLSASRYCYIGGFDATSNVLAGKIFGIPISGTHAHAFVSSYKGFEEVKSRKLSYADGSNVCEDFCELVKAKRQLVVDSGFLSAETNESELAAFTAYALAFPKKFLALIDTYDVLKSGAPNFITVTLALHDLGYQAIGVRLDSGDLAYQSKKCREMFNKFQEKFEIPFLGNCNIVASNDINEETLQSLNHQGHEINSYGVGTHLVTCQSQPALGAVFKLVEVNGEPRIKLSADPEKITLPGKKVAYRLFGNDDSPICDLLVHDDEKKPNTLDKIYCRHPFQESTRAFVRPKRVEQLHKLYWKDGKLQRKLPSFEDIKARVNSQLTALRSDHRRTLNPTPYKVSVSDHLYKFVHQLWLASAPIGELS